VTWRLNGDTMDADPGDIRCGVDGPPGMYGCTDNVGDVTANFGDWGVKLGDGDRLRRVESLCSIWDILLA